MFHKANIMKLTDGLFLRCARTVHDEEFPQIEYEEMIIDAGCMKLVQDPTRFDMLLLENLYGDVRERPVRRAWSAASAWCRAPTSATHGAVFEAVHGSAPDIAGKGVANPLALLMSAVMMLNHLAETRDDAACATAAQRIKDGLQPRPRRGPQDPRPRRHARHRRVRRRGHRPPRRLTPPSGLPARQPVTGGILPA